MEDYQKTEYVKEELTDFGLVEVDFHHFNKLCTACLCATRTTRTLDDDALKQYYMHILTKMQLEGGVVVLQSPRVCWECLSLLKRLVCFREQVQDSYRLLQPMLSLCDQEDQDDLYLPSSVCRPERLGVSFAYSLDISPENDNGDAASSDNSENDTEKCSITFLEADATLDGDTFELFCDEKYDAVSEEIVEVPLMRKNYRGREKNNEVSSRSLLKPIYKTNGTRDSTRDLENNFVCDYCQKGFTSNAALERHIATYKISPHNNKTVPSPCKDCAVVLCSDDQCSECPNKLNLLQHNNKQEKTEERFLSNECDKSFSGEEKLPKDLKFNFGEKPYPCEVCSKSYYYKQALMKHITTHTRESLYQCDVCRKSFTDRRSMISHIKTHTDQKPFKCELCDKSYTHRGPLNRHSIVHSGVKSFQCAVCHKSFIYQSGLNRHTSIHTGAKPHRCNMCDKSFSQKVHLISHVSRKHREGPDITEYRFCLQANEQKTGRGYTVVRIDPSEAAVTFANKSELLKDVSTHTPDKPFQCKVCGKRFALKPGLYQHSKIHAGDMRVKCDVCQKLFKTVKYFRLHYKYQHTGERPFRCKMCPESFSHWRDMIAHRRIHTGEKSPECDVCHKTFKEHAAVSKHKRRVHDLEKPYQCELCHRSFAYKDVFIGHIRRRHTDEKPFQCDICGKTFPFDVDLRKHNLIKHTEYKEHSTLKKVVKVKRIPCPYCSKMFNQNSQLTTHIRTHTGERPYQCEVCHKSFTQKAALRTHMSTHTGQKSYQCGVCLKSFALKATLNLHVKRVHDGVKSVARFKCEVCHKTFAQKSVFIGHQRVHSGERPFQCDVCGKTCALKHNLKAHMRRHMARNEC